MSKWFIEWESGRTEIVEAWGDKVSRNGRLETWPKDWSLKALLSAVKIPESIASATNFNSIMREAGLFNSCKLMRYLASGRVTH